MAFVTARKWLVGGFILSLCVNLFLLGGIFGGHFGAPWASPHKGMGLIMGTVPDDLKPAIREKFKAASESSKAEREALKQEMAAKRLRIAEALDADPFDPAHLETELAELGITATLMLDRAHRRIAEIAVDLTPEQRRQWAEGWRQARR